jgi:peptidoglycan/LPS O-acetylase OafA/YrhL
MHWALGRRLDEVLADPGNGFGVLRLAMALAVVFSHSFYLPTHLTEAEPLYQSTGYTLGQHAVHVFFVFSGLLVTASLARAWSMADFFAARALRILPGLAVCVILTGLVLGPLMTSLPLVTYLTSPAPYLYMLKTAALVTGNAPLPGVFDANPVAGEINIPVWTLKYEVICYAALGGVALAGIFRSWNATAFVLASVIVGSVIADVTADNPDRLAPSVFLASLGRLGLCFTIGVAAFVLKDRLFVGPAAVALAGVAYGLGRGTPIELALLVIFTAALSLGLAGASFGVLARATRKTDLSYGTYIYGWPVMQLLLSLDPDLGQAELFLLTLVLLIPLAYLSWRLVERPALSFKRRQPAPQLGSLGRRIAEARPPIAPAEVARLDVEGEVMPPPPTRRRINRALRTPARQTMRIVER